MVENNALYDPISVYWPVVVWSENSSFSSTMPARIKLKLLGEEVIKRSDGY
jgi:hypothetical protein